MVALTDTEARIVAALLDRASEKFSNFGCNDFDARTVGLDEEGRRALWRQLAEWSKDPDLSEMSHHWFLDWMLMSFFADKLKGK